MIKRIVRFVRFSETKLNLVAEGDIRVSFQRSTGYTGFSVSGDQNWTFPSWSISDDGAMGVTITGKVRRLILYALGRQPALYVNWQYKGKDHKRCVGRIEDLVKARTWADKVNTLYQEASEVA